MTELIVTAAFAWVCGTWVGWKIRALIAEEHDEAMRECMKRGYDRE